MHKTCKEYFINEVYDQMCPTCQVIAFNHKYLKKLVQETRRELKNGTHKA